MFYGDVLCIYTWAAITDQSLPGLSVHFQLHSLHSGCKAMGTLVLEQFLRLHPSSLLVLPDMLSTEKPQHFKHGSRHFSGLCISMHSWERVSEVDLLREHLEQWHSMPVD